MAASTLWASIDPSAQFRLAPEAFGDTSTSPERATRPVQNPPYHPNHPQFVFGAALIGTAGALYYLWEHGGVGAKAHAGPIGVEAEVGKGTKK